MITFLHAADIHLDSPLRGLERYEGAPATEIRVATRRAFENLVQLACDRKVDFVLLAGDLFDRQFDDFRPALFLTSQLYRLRDAGIRVVMIAGNHDAARKMSRSLTPPPNVSILSHSRPETVVWSDLGVAIHGQGFGQEAELANLAKSYPAPAPDYYNVGLLHTSLDGREGHDNYAPCSPGDLTDKGYDYWALGHVHTREVVSESPWIVFPGNSQGRHIRESGAKGCYLVEVDDQRQTSLSFVPLDVVRWEVCDVPADSLEHTAQLLEATTSALQAIADEANDRLMAVRVEISGRTPLHETLLSDPSRWSNEIRALAKGVSPDNLWIEKVKLLTQPPQSAHRAIGDEGPLAELAALIAELQASDEELDKLAAEFAPLRDKWPSEVRDLAEPLSSDPAQMRRLLEEVQALLGARMNPSAAER